MPAESRECVCPVLVSGNALIHPSLDLRPSLATLCPHSCHPSPASTMSSLASHLQGHLLDSLVLLVVGPPASNTLGLLGSRQRPKRSPHVHSLDSFSTSVRRTLLRPRFIDGEIRAWRRETASLSDQLIDGRTESIHSLWHRVCAVSPWATTSPKCKLFKGSGSLLLSTPV